MLQHYSIEELEGWDRFKRTHFINSLSGFKSTHLIGTTNSNGVHNLGLFHNVVHLGADPAMIGYVNRPREAAPHTLANIEATGQYTMNAISAPWVQAAHQCSAKYPAEVSEFDATGLTPLFREGVKAPFVAESSIQYGMELIEIVPITHNNTYLVIGRVTGIWVQASLVGTDGFIDLAAGEIVTSAGIDAYYSPTLLHRFPYAKPTP